MMNYSFQLEGVTRTYPDFTLGPLDLTLEPGTIAGYIGPNGSGKTTTMQAIMGLIAIDDGSIQVLLPYVP